MDGPTNNWNVIYIVSFTVPNSSHH